MVAAEGDALPCVVKAGGREGDTEGDADTVGDDVVVSAVGATGGGEGDDVGDDETVGDVVSAAVATGAGEGLDDTEGDGVLSAGVVAGVTGAGEEGDDEVEGSFTVTDMINPAEQSPAMSHANTMSPTSAWEKV